MPAPSAFETASLRIGLLTLSCVLACASRAADDTERTNNSIVGTTVTLGGVTATLDPTAGDGPFYFRGSALIPDAAATVAGTLPPVNQMSGLVFTNLPAVEYAVAVSENAPSTVFLRNPAALFGYPDPNRPGVIRTPVLDRYYSLVVAESRCERWSTTEARTCAPSPLDAGAP